MRIGKRIDRLEQQATDTAPTDPPQPRLLDLALADREFGEMVIAYGEAACPFEGPAAPKEELDRMLAELTAARPAAEARVAARNAWRTGMGGRA